MNKRRWWEDGLRDLVLEWGDEISFKGVNKATWNKKKLFDFIKKIEDKAYEQCMDDHNIIHGEAAKRFFRDMKRVNRERAKMTGKEKLEESENIKQFLKLTKTKK